MSSTFLPRKSDSEAGLPVAMWGRVKSACRSPTLGAYSAAGAGIASCSSHETVRFMHFSLVPASTQLVEGRPLRTPYTAAGRFGQSFQTARSPYIMGDASWAVG